ncbi:hypothetical protein [Sphingobium sp. TomTYG45]
MTDDISVFIAESLSPKDFYERRLDGFAANEVLKIQSCPTDYRIVLTRKYLRRAIEEADENNYAIFHLSCHGDSDGIQLADGTEIDWLTLARMFKPYATLERCLVLASCSGGHFAFTKALVKVGATFGYVFGSTDVDGVGFTDSCLAWSVLYRELIENGLERDTLRRAVETINVIAPGKFVYRRWSGSIYQRYPAVAPLRLKRSIV